MEANQKPEKNENLHSEKQPEVKEEEKQGKSTNQPPKASNEPKIEADKPKDPIFLEDNEVLPESMSRGKKEEEKNDETDSNWTETMTENEDDGPLYVVDPEMDEINDAVFGNLDEEEGKSQLEEEDNFLPHKSTVRSYNFHKNCVVSLGHHPANPNIFYSGGMDDAVAIWDIRETKDEPIFQRNDFGETVSLIQPNFDETLLAISVMNNSLKIIDLKNRSLLHDITEVNDEILSLKWHPKGNALLIAANDGVVHILNAGNGKMFNSFYGHEKGVTKADYSSDGKLVVTSSLDGSIRTWHPQTGIQASKVSGYGFHDEAVIDFSMHESKPMLISGGTDGHICFVNIQSGKSVYKSEKMGKPIEKVLMAEGFEISLSGGQDKTIRIWDTAKMVQREKISVNGSINHIVQNKERNLFIASTTKGYVSIFDHRCPDKIKEIQCHGTIIQDLILLNHNQFVTCSDDGYVRVMDLAAGLD